MSKLIWLTKGKVAVVDDGDYELVNGFKWYVHNTGSRLYAAHRDNSTGFIYLHRFLMGFPKGLMVDHKNGHGLDCRRTNLRICTHTQNMANARTKKGRKYKGVHWHSQNQIWRAQILVNGKTQSLGCFSDPKDAALAHDKAARKYHGEFAFLNFPQEVCHL